jgi:tRNA modification GTPase
MHDLSTTLVAVGTPPGRGGIGCLRISGPRSSEIARGLFRAASRGASPAAGGPPCFGRFLDRQGRALDHGYLVLFPASASFTGESSAELWTHGSPAVLGELVEAAVAAGALPSGPGEFTYRAMRNGRIDLSRAEAVRDLVEARTRYQARLAFAQADGAVARRVTPLRELLEEWIARGEAAVEFVDETETHLPSGALGRAIERARTECQQLLSGFRQGRVVRDGATLAIVGLPNVGKSSLFNRLLEQDRAIVTEIAGTTRDTLEEDLDVGGIPVRLIDTAGLRSVVDPVEGEGVRRAQAARAEADLVLLVLDGSRSLQDDERSALERVASGPERERTIAVLNKSDLPSKSVDVSCSGTPLIRVSALRGDGIEDLRRELREHLIGSGTLEAPVITNARHARSLEQAAASLEQAWGALQQGLTEEIVVEDLGQAMRHLGQITGEFTTEDLYDRIFSTFCIGK